MSSDRREFIQRLALGGIALGSLPTMLEAAPAPFTMHTLSGAALSRGLQDQPMDVSWPKRLTGKHKAVFDSPDIGGGLGVYRAGVVAAQYAQTFKEQPSDFSSVIVLRHNGIHLAMNPTYWSTYKIGKKYNATHPMTDKKTKRNPVLMTVEDDQLPANFGKYALHKQIERGTIVLACNLAFGGMVATVAKEEKLKTPEARAKALTMMVPGVILQPNGIFGVTLAQQNGCAFVQAT